MYISDLALQGFKSFANKEKLSFGEGITAVVGPNGCGKTNIVDAIRWVLGEQKYSTLRSSRMEDIIFSGSESKRPVNVCEVSLVVHNNRGILPLDYNDVEIARRIFRNGESQYMINRGKCRLKDIQDLFVDTGMGADAYSVIELKMIEDILSENADDRRRMFEEAAGINKYKHQRKTTLNRLELTKSDLDRVGDIIAEVDTKVNALRLQLKRFDRHIKMTHKLREYELELAFIQKSELEEKIIPLNENIQSLTLHQSTSKDAEKGREDVLDKLRAISKSQQEEMSAIQERIDSLSANQHEKSNRILILNEQTKTAERDIIRADNESEESNIRIDGYQQAMKTVKKELENVDPLVDTKLSAYNEAKTKLEQNNIAFTNSQQSFDELTGQLMQRHKEENDMKSLLERSEFLLADRVKQKQELSNQADEIVEQISILEKNQLKAEESVNSVKSQIEDQTSQLWEQNKTFDELSEKMEALFKKSRIAESREASLERQIEFNQNIIDTHESHPGGARSILNNLKDHPGILGALSDLIKVDEEYRPALDAALGEYQSLLVSKTHNQAVKAALAINKLKAGAVSIIPLDAIRSIDKLIPPKMDGVIGCAADFITVTKSLKPLADYLLGNTILVKDSKAAAALRKESEFEGNIAVLDGTFYDLSGVVRTKRGDEKSILSRKEEISKLHKELSGVRKEASELAGNLSSLEKTLTDLKRTREKRIEDLEGLRSQLTEATSEAARNQAILSQNSKRNSELSTAQATVNNEIKELEKSIKHERPKIDKQIAKISTLEAKLEVDRSALENNRSEYESSNSQVQQIRLDLIELEKGRDNLKYRLEGLEENVAEKEQRKSDLVMEQEQLKSALSKMSDEIDELEKDLEKINAKYLKEVSIRDLKKEAFSETQDQIEEHEREIRGELRERERETEELKRLELQVADYTRQTDLIAGRIQEKYDADIPASMQIDKEAGDLALEIDKVERSLERIGPVNMAVKDEYETENSRLEFLQKQLNDLEESEKSLIKSIHHIDAKARKQFTETFDAIRENFKKTFVLFFEGGEADLNLRGDDDPLESDITILAKPPGKRTRNLRMLSGGEKALTAISLLFSIYQVKPSPFCILDEVDAPLDDHNIVKFTRALKKFSDQTQFIIVTHNKLTMEAAKYLYGVTMEQSGVSKIVSVNFD